MNLSCFMFYLVNLMSEVIEQSMSAITNKVILKLQNIGEGAKTLWRIFVKILKWIKRNELVKPRLLLKPELCIFILWALLVVELKKPKP